MQPAVDFGTETDGTPSAGCCVFSYKQGTLCTMEEMVRTHAQ